MTKKKAIGGIVVYCSDPRTENANLWKDIKQHLIPQEQRLTPIGCLGAAVALARPADFPVKFAAIMEDIHFALEEFSEGSFIVVGHDCGIYKRLAPRIFSLHEKMNDIAIAAGFLRSRFPDMPVAAWFKQAGGPFEPIS